MTDVDRGVGAGALQFQGDCSSVSTTNEDDYALTSSPAIFTNNVGSSFTVNTVPNACCENSDCDDGDDCTIDTCASENGCGNEFHLQVYGDICEPFDPPSAPQPNLDDILCELDDFIDGPAVDGCACSGFRKSTDLHPCPEDGGGDGSITMDDILKMLDAFAGQSPCDDPCP